MGAQRIKNEKCRDAENQNETRCNSDATAPNVFAVCLCVAMSQPRCQILYARPGGRLQCEHGSKQRPHSRRNACRFQLLDGKRGRLLSSTNFLNVAPCKWRFPSERKPERSA